MHRSTIYFTSNTFQYKFTVRTVHVIASLFLKTITKQAKDSFLSKIESEKDIHLSFVIKKDKQFSALSPPLPVRRK